MNFKLRKVKESDFEQLYKLSKEFEKYYQPIAIEEISVSKAQIKIDFFKNKLKNYFIVAEVEKKLVGYFEGEFEKKNKRGYIVDIFVSEKFRNLGIANKMKDSFLEELKKKKYKEIILDVNKKKSCCPHL